MHNVLVPVDGSVHALKAAHIACDFAQKYEGRISLLFVEPAQKSAKKLLSLLVAKSFDADLMALLQRQATTNKGLASSDAIEAAGEKILAQAAGKIRHQGITANILPIAKGDVVEAILATIKQTDASMVVLGSRGASDQEEAAFGSVSHAVFQRAECTCLAVK